MLQSPRLIPALLLVSVSLHAGQLEEETADKQVVVETEAGTLILEVFPRAAPTHVRAFQGRIRSGFYVGTTLHRAVPMGIVQGGDPLTRDPSNRALFGTGGLRELKREVNQVTHSRGTLSAVLIPGEPDSAGSQFFICVTDQPALDGNYTAFGRVVEGFEVLEKISQLPTDGQQRLLDRIEITATYERDRPPPPEVPFEKTPVSSLASYSVVVGTDLGEIEIGFFPQSAPQHVRQFLRFARLGLYTGTLFHRIVPGFVIQGGSLTTREEPVSARQAEYVRPLKAEFNEHKHVRGIVSMARGSDEDSAVDSFFIVLAPSPSLDGKYTVFGEVIQGMATVDGISQVPTRGTSPIVPVRIQSVRVRERE